MQYLHVCQTIRCHINLASHRRRNHISPAVILLKTLLNYHQIEVWMFYAILLTYKFIIFFPEMTQIGFVFDVDEVMKVLEDAKTEISNDTSVIMTR